MTSRNQIRLEISSTTRLRAARVRDTGAYERLLGKACHYAIDPDEDGLPDIVDLELAPAKRRRPGRVLCDSRHNQAGRPRQGQQPPVLRVLQPRQPRPARRLYTAPAPTLTSPAYAGDGYSMRQGYTLMWSGWQGDLIDQGAQRVVANLPFALQDGKPLRGRVRQEFNPMEAC